MAIELPCYRCGYDLRAHPSDGACPECGAAVEESARVAAIPRRPAWRDSDRRWRRRVVAGAWVLVLVPLMELLRGLDLASRVTLPGLVDLRGATRTLDETLLGGYPFVYQSLVFCIGAGLLFAHERGRHGARFDWTRRWGGLCGWAVLLLCAANLLYITALVGIGIGALFQSLPTRYQPGWTGLLVDVSSGYLRYGAHPGSIAAGVLVAFSSIVVLFACVPLYDALRSTGSTRATRGARILLAPLAAFALLHLSQAVRYCGGLPNANGADMAHYGLYFSPELLLSRIARSPYLTAMPPSVSEILMEIVKWGVVLSIAVWLSVAQVATWRRGSGGGHAPDETASPGRGELRAGASAAAKFPDGPA
jgi:hypothetical protein